MNLLISFQFTILEIDYVKLGQVTTYLLIAGIITWAIYKSSKNKGS